MGDIRPDARDGAPLAWDERIARIAEEERIRRDLRSQLDPPIKKGMVWEFLNSTFGIFLLSSVVITGLSKVFSDYQSYNQRKLADYKELSSLITEFDYRTREVEYIDKRLEEPSMTADDRAGHGVLLWRVVTGDSAYQPTSPEFKNVHWLAIATKMRLDYPEVDSAGIQNTIFKIETGKNSQWIYDVPLLKREAVELRTYLNKVSDQYTKDSGRSAGNEDWLASL